MKIFNAISILVVVAFLAPTMSAAQEKKDEKTILASGKYRYQGDKTNDVDCQRTDIGVCVSIERFKELCRKGKSLTVNAAKFAITSEGYRDKGALYLIENNAESDFSTSWKENNKNIAQSCATSLTIKGIFQGSQFNKTFEGYVNLFLINDKGDILVHQISKIY